MNMKSLLYILMLGLLTACGSAGAGESMPPGPVGIYIDSTFDQYLEKYFADVKACTKLEKGEFSDLSVIIMPLSYKCQTKDGVCSGDFTPPNYIHLGAVGLWGHEVIHYLLFLNTGDPDPDHQSLLFGTCSNPQTGTAVIG